MIPYRLTQTIAMVVLAFGTAASVDAQGEEQQQSAVGDSTLKGAVAPLTRAIYDQDNKWVFVLTEDNVLDLEGGFGAEVRGSRINDTFNHIVAVAWTPLGKYGVEYFLSGDDVIFVYETFEYFAEVSRPASWRNFKGLASWERRSYPAGSSIGYTEISGQAEPAESAELFVQTAKRLINLLSKKHDR